MESLTKQLQVIKKKYPEQSERIEELFGKNEDFRTLCSDYFVCIKHLEKFKREYGEKKLTLKEYKSIRAELENELFGFIFDV
jgi:hypothetical protein